MILFSLATLIYALRIQLSSRQGETWMYWIFFRFVFLLYNDGSAWCPWAPIANTTLSKMCFLAEQCILLFFNVVVRSGRKWFKFWGILRAIDQHHDHLRTQLTSSIHELSFQLRSLFCTYISIHSQCSSKLSIFVLPENVYIFCHNCYDSLLQ